MVGWVFWGDSTTTQLYRDYSKPISRWWLKNCWFLSLFGETIQFDDHDFSNGSFNRQVDLGLMFFIVKRYSLFCFEGVGVTTREEQIDGLLPTGKTNSIANNGKMHESPDRSTFWLVYLGGSFQERNISTHLPREKQTNHVPSCSPLLEKLYSWNCLIVAVLKEESSRK